MAYSPYDIEQDDYLLLSKLRVWLLKLLLDLKYHIENRVQEIQIASSMPNTGIINLYISLFSLYITEEHRGTNRKDLLSEANTIQRSRFLIIRKTRLFKYTEFFTTKKWNFSDKIWYVSCFCSTHKL